MALSPISIAALGLLAERPMHPYEMYQLLLDRQEDRVLKVRPGTLYHAVDRLARDGLVRAAGTEREGSRPERTTFEITEPGRRELLRRVLEMLAAPAQEYPEFALAISEAHNLSRTQVIACLRTRLQAMRDEQQHLEDRVRSHGGGDVPRLYWLNVDYERAMRAAELQWLGRVLDELESGALPWRESDEVRAHAARNHAAGGRAALTDEPGAHGPRAHDGRAHPARPPDVGPGAHHGEVGPSRPATGPAAGPPPDHHDDEHDDEEEQRA